MRSEAGASSCGRGCPGVEAFRLQVLAKIESADAVECLDSILDAVDGAMVARGDLGAELPVECVPFWQSAIVQVRCGGNSCSASRTLVGQE